MSRFKLFVGRHKKAMIVYLVVFVVGFAYGLFTYWDDFIRPLK